MHYRLQGKLVPLAMAHLMGRPTESTEEGPIRFRVQADRRRAQKLADGAIDRRARRGTEVLKNEGSDAVRAHAGSAHARITPQE